MCAHVPRWLLTAERNARRPNHIWVCFEQYDTGSMSRVRLRAGFLPISYFPSLLPEDGSPLCRMSSLKNMFFVFVHFPICTQRKPMTHGSIGPCPPKPRKNVCARQPRRFRQTVCWALVGLLPFVGLVVIHFLVSSTMMT